MSESNPMKYLPTASFYRHADPAHKGLLRTLLSEDLIYQSTVDPGGRDNITWISLRPEDKLDDPGMPGSESNFSKYRLPSLLLNYDTKWVDCFEGDWMYTPTPQEHIWRNLAKTSYQSDYDEINAKSVKTPQDLAEMATLQGLLDNLSENGPGYIQYGQNMLGTGATGITYGLAAANVPVVVTSTFFTQKNRGQSFRLKRLEPAKDQVNHHFTIELGNGNSLYAIVIGADGNKSKFVHYRNMSEGKRKKLIKELNLILDKTRLSVLDMVDKNAWETEINSIHIKKRKEGRRQYSTEENTRLFELKKLIKDLKESKRGLSVVDTERKSEIEKQLYLSRESFSLSESTKSMIGQTVDFSVIFLRSGYVLIQSKDGRKIYENKRFTGGVPAGAQPIFGDMLPSKAYITIKSNGGMWSMAYGHPEHDASGLIQTQPFEIPFEFNIEDIQWIRSDDTANPGCLIKYKLTKLTEAIYFPEPHQDVLKVPATYQISLEMRSDHEVPKEQIGRYSPEVNYVEFYIKRPLPGEPQLIWDSNAPENMWPSPINKNKIRDLLVQDERYRARLCTLVISNSLDETNLGFQLAGAASDIQVYNQDTDETTYIHKHGYTAKVNRGEMLTIEHKVDPGELQGTSDDKLKLLLQSVSGNEVVASISGCEGFLNREIENHVTGHGMYLGDYLKLYARDAGLPPELYEGLPTGNEDGCPRIPNFRPGFFPECKPTIGAIYWQWMTYVVKTYAPKWELWTNVNGLRLTKKAARRREDLLYSTTADAGSPGSMIRASTQRSNVKLTQDTREYWTKAIFIGAMNPSTGMRYTGYAEIPQATDERFKDSMFYVNGTPNVYTSDIDESLKSDAACTAAAEDKLNIAPLHPQGLPPWILEWEIPFDESITGGDIPTVNGIKFVMDKIEFGALNVQGNKGQYMEVSGQLAEDIELVKD